LKRDAEKPGYQHQRVAPRRGAWIETSGRIRPCDPNEVAPRRGAWIETPHSGLGINFYSSHPAGVRGLKLCFPERHKYLLFVAPRRGAWIETENILTC